MVQRVLLKYSGVVLGCDQKDSETIKWSISFFYLAINDYYEATTITVHLGSGATRFKRVGDSAKSIYVAAGY